MGDTDANLAKVQLHLVDARSKMEDAEEKAAQTKEKVARSSSNDMPSGKLPKLVKATMPRWATRLIRWARMKP